MTKIYIYIQFRCDMRFVKNLSLKMRCASVCVCGVRDQKMACDVLKLKEQNFNAFHRWYHLFFLFSTFGTTERPNNEWANGKMKIRFRAHNIHSIIIFICVIQKVEQKSCGRWTFWIWNERFERHKRGAHEISTSDRVQKKVSIVLRGYI